MAKESNNPIAIRPLRPISALFNIFISFQRKADVATGRGGRATINESLIKRSHELVLFPGLQCRHSEQSAAK